MDYFPLTTSSTVIPVENFWSSVLVYHDKPHVVNRKLAAISPLLFCEISFHCPRVKHFHEIFTREALLYQIRKLQDLEWITTNFIRRIIETYDAEATIEETTLEKVQDSFEGYFVSLRTLIPRGSCDKCLEIVIFDKSKSMVTFFAVQEADNHIVAPRFPYHVELTRGGNLRVLVNSIEDANTNSAVWLCDKLFYKLLSWSEKTADDSIVTSLSLIAPDEYYTRYTELKIKYGYNLVEKWPQKAKTDPQKYVYEDIAIATYLICLWRKLKERDVSFVDCGCGNGLLVYILNQEGYKGFGLDIRRREVWDLYSNKADLRVEAVRPESMYPGCNWIIGNHSDELTPWIPVIALNSSPVANFFVLPCCPYDFNGRKYVRSNTALSQYGDYLEYVKKISNICGFVTSVDKLRIPSTRRTCLIGVRDRSEVFAAQMTKRKTEISAFIKARSSSEFVPRSSTERVRNCTQLNRGFIYRIVSFVVTELLRTQNIRITAAGIKWNSGGRIDLKDLCDKMSLHDKFFLKKECGGLQTLLKNHRYIFDVRHGAVALQNPLSLEETDKYKEKPCWFLRNHPDGCFFDSKACAYEH